jgi:hypothetical protein
MAEGKQAKLTLPPSALLITLIPLTVIFVTGALMQLGFPAGHFGLPRSPAGDAAIMVHWEAAGRMKVLATWALLAAMSLGCIGYFAFSLSRFEKRTRRLLVAFYVLCSLFGMGFTMVGGGGSGERVLGETVLCSSLRLLVKTTANPGDGADHATQSAPPRPAYRCPGDGPAGGSATDSSYDLFMREIRILTCPSTPDAPAICEATVPGYVLLRRLNLIQRLLIPWAATTLVLGAISCLATRRGVRKGPAADREQAERLHTYLYLTAALFVCGLLFLSALLQWPGYAFQGKAAEAYRAHASAFVLYWGVAYSIIIAAYYLPVAILLSRRGGKSVLGRASPTGSDPAMNDALGPLDLLKIVAGIFAPAIAGLLGEIIQL